MADNVALQHKIIGAQANTFASASTVTGQAIDARGYTFATFVIYVQTTTGTAITLDVKTQMDDNSGFSSATDITSGAITQMTAVESADNTTRILVLDLRRVSERYIRTSATAAGTTVTSVPLGITCILSNGPIQTVKADYTDYDANF